MIDSDVPDLHDLHTNANPDLKMNMNVDRYFCGSDYYNDNQMEFTDNIESITIEHMLDSGLFQKKK